MFDYFGMAYRDSDYTVVIAIMQNNCAETHLGGGDTSDFVMPLATIDRRWLPVVLRRPHKVSDHTAMIAVIR